ncbi:hypothetical protein QMO56_18880 [Roseomonas sp. E05]|uniref:hypothetical protein n=1 Tax=Roseomonas sp. E05 TaxID=3046310 RepID=UPI0024B89960|nr:hypothetical protein [Roseomonas sp. E05]MDJ0390179.1 hypothetical protein [Roseomonas sp. E05]
MKNISERDLRWLDEHGLKGRSPLYKFIRKNFAKLKARRAGEDDGPSWARLAEWLASQGQTNSRGEPLSWDAVRKVFTRVSRDLEAEDRARRFGVAAKAKPARAPAGWQPPVVSPRPAAPTLPTTPRPEAPRKDVAPFARSPTTDGEHATDDEVSPEELMAGFKAIVAQRSGR